MTEKSRRKIVVVMAVITLLVVIQFIPVEINSVSTDTGAAVRPPKNIEDILVKACFDCHSDQLKMPWYGEVAPVSWLVVHDINEGREHLNFTLWARYPADKKAKLLKESVKELEEGEMPLASYKLLHPEARLTAAERNELIDWFKAEAK